MEIKGIVNKAGTNAYNDINNDKSNSLDKEVKNAGNRLEDKNIGKRGYTEEELIESIEAANEEFIIYDKKFEFSIHEKTKKIMVKIIDVSTEEVIKEIPPEKILDVVASLWETAGIIVDEKI